MSMTHVRPEPGQKTEYEGFCDGLCFGLGIMLVDVAWQIMAARVASHLLWTQQQLSCR